MTETPDTPATRTRPDAIEPMIPEMPRESLRTDGGRIPERETPREPFDRPPRTDHASGFTRCTEEIEPMVPDLR